jgi:hypothetical protein
MPPTPAHLPRGGFHPPGGTGPEVASRVERLRDSRRHFGWGVAHPMNIQEAGGRNSANPWLTNPRFRRLCIDDEILQTAHGACRSSRGISPAHADIRAKPRKRLTIRLSSNLYTPTQPCPTFAQNPNFVEPDYPSKCVAVLFTP